MSYKGDNLPFFAFITGTKFPSKHMKKSQKNINFFIVSSCTKTHFSTNRKKIKKLVDIIGTWYPVQT